MTDFSALLADLAALQGEVTLDGRHVYRHRKVYRPGVSTIIKVMDAPRLDEWKVRMEAEGTARAAYANRPLENEPEAAYVARIAAQCEKLREHDRISKEAADIGKQVHALIEHAAKTQLGIPMEPPAVGDEALFRFSGWRQWADSVDLKPLMVEGKILHPTENFCGTFDLVCLVNGAPAVLDWKAKETVYDERRLQSAAYRKALMARGWPPLDGAVVSVPAGGDIRMVPCEAPGPALDAAFEAFLALLRVFRWKKEVAKAEREAA